MNIVYDQNEISKLSGIIEIVKSYPNPHTQEDGPIKWASVMQVMNFLTFNSSHTYTKVLDIGCGNSLLPIMIADQSYKVIAVDKHAINETVMLDLRIPTHIISAYEYLESIKDNSVDVIIDSCAAIHFDPNLPDPSCLNGGCAILGELIKRKLHPSGYFITVTDFALDRSNYEFMKLDQLIDCYECSGLRLCGERPKIPENPFHITYDVYRLGIVRLIFQK